jgi:hypothetical protein
VLHLCCHPPELGFSVPGGSFAVLHASEESATYTRVASRIFRVPDRFYFAAGAVAALFGSALLAARAFGIRDIV